MGIALAILLLAVLLGGVGLVIGAAVAYLLDPDRGRSRRSRLYDQTSALARRAMRRSRSRIEYQKGTARGVAHKLSNGGFSLQAEVTFESEPGVTYFLQAGSFGLFQDPDFPEFDSLPEYGLLKISASG